MTIRYTLDEEEIIKVIAEKYKTGTDKVKLIITPTVEGYGLGERVVHKVRAEFELKDGE